MTAPAATAASTTTGAGRKRVGLWVLAGVALVLVGVLAGAPNQEGDDYDPTSNGQQGTKALVQLLRDYGADVSITDRQPPVDADIAVMFPGAVPADRNDALRRWVAEGHTLVVADPRSELNPFGAERNRFLGGFAVAELESGRCDIAALRDANVLRLGDDTQTVGSARRFPVPAGAQQCFTRATDVSDDDSLAAIVSVPEGRGQIVSVGAPSVFVNELLDEGDNAVVAVDLLAPTTGQRVAVLQRPPGTVADPSLGDLLSTGVKLAILQLFLAFVVYAFFRGRRLGKPIVEAQAVSIPGSELVSAVGNLLQQTKSPDRAAVVLRAELRRRLSERLGLPAGVSAEVIAASIEARAGVPQEDSLPLIADLPCATEAELLDLAAGVDDLRRRVLGGA